MIYKVRNIVKKRGSETLPYTHCLNCGTELKGAGSKITFDPAPFVYTNIIGNLSLNFIPYLQR